MELSNSSDPSISSVNMDKLLEYLNVYILTLARKNVPRNIVDPSLLDLEIDELAQNTRIKLWRALEKNIITNVRGYIKRLVYTESVNLVRHYKALDQLVIDEEGEIYQGTVLVTQSQGMQDPADELEQEEMLADFVERVLSGTLALPPRQRHAMICSLKDQLDDLAQLIDILARHAVDVEAVHWPEEKDELQRHRAALSVARRKLRTLRLLS